MACYRENITLLKVKVRVGSDTAHMSYKVFYVWDFPIFNTVEHHFSPDVNDYRLNTFISSYNITPTNVPKTGLDKLFQTKPKFAKIFRWGKNFSLWPLCCLWMNYRLLVLTWFDNSIIWFTARCKHTPQAGGPPLVGSSTLLIVEMFERICSLGKIANLK